MKKPVPTLRSMVSAKVSMISLLEHLTGTLSHKKPGAMSWAFLEAMKSNGAPTYKEAGHARHRSFGSTNITQALHLTRALLKASEYTQVMIRLTLIFETPANDRQVPQLCVGSEMNLDQPLIL